MEAKTDGRSLQMATQGQVRRLVVKAVRGGLKQGAAAKRFAVSLPGGEQVGGTGQGWRPTGAEVEASRSAAGSGRVTSGQSARIRGLIVSKTPDQLKLPFYLWTRAGVATLIEREYGIAVSLTTVGRYLRAWGMTPQKPARRAYETNDSAIKGVAG